MKTMNKYGAMLGAVGILALGGCATTSDPFNTTSNSSTTYPETNNAGNAGNTSPVSRFLPALRGQSRLPAF